MDIIIQSLGFTASANLEIFIRQKLLQLNAGNAIRARVTLYRGPSGNIDSDYCEMRLEVPGNDQYVKKHNAHFETAVSECVEVLAQLLQKSKQKETNRQTDEALVQDEMMND